MFFFFIFFDVLQVTLEKLFIYNSTCLCYILLNDLLYMVVNIKAYSPWAKTSNLANWYDQKVLNVTMFLIRYVCRAMKLCDGSL